LETEVGEDGVLEEELGSEGGAGHGGDEGLQPFLADHLAAHQRREFPEGSDETRVGVPEADFLEFAGRQFPVRSEE
jgi:hypothetical protein